MRQKIEFRVNGVVQSVETDGERPLLEVLQEDLGLNGPKFGCGEGECGACTILLNGRAVRSCNRPVRSVAGRTITTIEGLAPDGNDLHPVQQAFIDEGAMQCGYCVPGLILGTVDLLREKPEPTREDIDLGMQGHLCRCCGYPRIIAAIERASKLMKEAGAK